MNTTKTMIILIISALLLGGFPDFRVTMQDKYTMADSFFTPDRLLLRPTPAITPKPTATPTPKPTPRPTPSPTPLPLGKTQAESAGELTFSYPEPAALNTNTSTYTLIVNKEYLLPSGYIPYMVEPDVEIYHKGINERRYLQPVAATALEELFAAAEADGYHLVLRCGFRSYKLQKAIYSWNLKTYGYYEVSRYHALPGTSEHQTGLAVDLCCEATDYKNNYDILKTQEYKWLLENAHLYGWILRYPENKKDITGYNFEPWHFRYVGVELATYLKEQNIVLEEYYGVPPTSNLLVPPEEYWELLSEADYALMLEDIAAYEKKQEELAAQVTPEPTPDVAPVPSITPNPDTDPEVPSDEEADLTPVPEIPSDEEPSLTPVPEIPLDEEPSFTPEPEISMDAEPVPVPHDIPF
ncbi:MAG: D-alanyl-D-alanine carboxypeptidase family protein [Lachnospiraceae bacterium]|nr:D-alanyl-D-alanine carboxypeptidase family protein [Lachnospiraceae bacterium]